MSKQEVRVGQVWRLRHGVEIHVDAVDATRVLWTSIDHTVAGSYYLALFSRHTLVQDAPETVDWTAGGRWKPEADGYPDPAFYVHGKGLVPVPEAAFQQDACSALRGTLPGDKWITPQGQVVTVDRYKASSNNVFFKELPGGMFPEGLASWARPGDGSCLATRAMLSKSERFTQSEVTHAGERTPEHPPGMHEATADLRRRVASLREWPMCPVSKQELRIVATVSEERDRGYGRRGEEVLRQWQAAFTCPHCTGGGK